MRQLNVLDPGRFRAIGPLLDNLPTNTCQLVRQNASLLRAVNVFLAEMVSRANNHFTLLVGLSRPVMKHRLRIERLASCSCTGASVRRQPNSKQ